MIRNKLAGQLDDARRRLALARKYRHFDVAYLIGVVDTCERNLQSLDDLEYEAFKYAMINVNGSTEKITKIHWGIYKNGQSCETNSRG